MCSLDLRTRTADSFETHQHISAMANLLGFKDRAQFQSPVHSDSLDVIGDISLSKFDAVSSDAGMKSAQDNGELAFVRTATSRLGFLQPCRCAAFSDQ